MPDQTKDSLLLDIKTLSEKLGKTPSQKEANENGISWRRHFSNFTECIEAAGLTPNPVTPRKTDDEILDVLAEICRQEKKPITYRQWCLSSLRESSQMGKNSYNRFGQWSDFLSALRRRSERLDQADLLEILPTVDLAEASEQGEAKGWVYIGKHEGAKEGLYKIGCTNNPDRRRNELNAGNPGNFIFTHQIETADPKALEQVWHSHFKNKRKYGEYFELSPQDVRLFKRDRKYP